TPDITKFQPDELKGRLANYTEPPQIVSASAPRTDATTHTDREIALAYLLNQKAAAKNYASSVLECANPELRTFLENAFLNSSRHSYDVWQYMAQNGYYPLSPAPQEDIQMVSSMYQIVPQPPLFGGQQEHPQTFLQ